MHAAFAASDGVCPHATLMTTSTPKTQWTVANTVAFGRGVTTISTRSACVENENMWSRVLCLVHMRCVFFTDISLVSTMTIWRGFQENTFVCWCTCPIVRVRCACKVKHISNLKSFLHFMVHVVDSGRKLIEDTSCLQCLTHFETFRDKQVTLSFTVREIAVVPPREHCTVMRCRRKSIIIDHISKSTTCSFCRVRSAMTFWQGRLLWSS